jgi:hypothetical protein
MKNELISTFNIAVAEYLTSIKEDNFNEKYAGLQSLVGKYNDIGMPRKEILELLGNFYSRAVDDWTEEVVGEIINCIEGFTSPNNVIALKE